jgi:ABC-type spermidine/putrescine transport system permease subunit I
MESRIIAIMHYICNTTINYCSVQHTIFLALYYCEFNRKATTVSDRNHTTSLFPPYSHCMSPHIYLRNIVTTICMCAMYVYIHVLMAIHIRYVIRLQLSSHTCTMTAIFSYTLQLQYHKLDATLLQ